MRDALEAALREAFDVERATSEGNAWNLNSREFVISRVLTSAALAARSEPYESAPASPVSPSERDAQPAHRGLASEPGQTHEHGPLSWKAKGWSCDVCGAYPVKIGNAARSEPGAEGLLDAIRAYGDARSDVAYGRATRKAIDHAWDTLLTVAHIPPMDQRAALAETEPKP